MILDALVVVGVAIVVARWVGLALAAARRGRRTAGAATAERVTVVIPAWNEVDVLGGTIRGALASDTAVRVVVVDDGSTDGTGDLARALGVEVVCHPTNRGKAAALNTGFARADTTVVVTLDADTVPDPTAIRRLAAALDAPAVAAAASNVKVADRGRWLGRWQSIEYVAGIHLGRRAHQWAGAMATVPGALSAWRRAAVLSVGGFSGRTLAEDTDLTLTLQRRGHHVRFVDDAVARTQAPPTIPALFRQRRRWLAGNLQCATLHLGGFTDGPAGLRAVALPDLWWTHLGVYLLVPLTLAWLPHGVDQVGVPGLLLLGAGLAALDVAGVVLAYRVDREPVHELVHLPLQRLLFPLLMWGVFASVVVGARVRWDRTVRRPGPVDALPAPLEGACVRSPGSCSRSPPGRSRAEGSPTPSRISSPDRSPKRSPRAPPART